MSVGLALTLLWAATALSGAAPEAAWAQGTGAAEWQREAAGGPDRPGAAGRADGRARVTAADALAEQAFRGHCSVCHSLQVVQQQQLDRATWDWVMDDMVQRFGATWITGELREVIVDYLVRHHGPPD